MPRSPAPLLAIAALVAGFAACAQAAPFNPDRLPPAEVAGVGGVCASVMRLEPGEARYQGCFESLSRSLTTLGAGRAHADAHAACAAQGLQPRTPDMAVCTLTRSEQAGTERALPVLASSSQLALPGGGRSYAMTSNADRRARERLSCAMIGLDPSGPAFDGCVAGLAQALFALDNPQN